MSPADNIEIQIVVRRCEGNKYLWKVIITDNDGVAVERPGWPSNIAPMHLAMEVLDLVRAKIRHSDDQLGKFDRGGLF